MLKVAVHPWKHDKCREMGWHQPLKWATIQTELLMNKPRSSFWRWRVHSGGRGAGAVPRTSTREATLACGPAACCSARWSDPPRQPAASSTDLAVAARSCTLHHRTGHGHGIQRPRCSERSSGRAPLLCQLRPYLEEATRAGHRHPNMAIMGVWGWRPTFVRSHLYGNHHRLP
jgi:hypothetical protein